MIVQHNPKVLKHETACSSRNRRSSEVTKFKYGFVQKSRYLGISYEFEQSKNMEILTVRQGTTFVKKTFVGSRERNQREKVCVCVSSKMKEKKERKEEKEGRKEGREWNGKVPGFSRVITPLVLLHIVKQYR